MEKELRLLKISDSKIVGIGPDHTMEVTHTVNFDKITGKPVSYQIAARGSDSGIVQNFFGEEAESLYQEYFVEGTKGGNTLGVRDVVRNKQDEARAAYLQTAYEQLREVAYKIDKIRVARQVLDAEIAQFELDQNQKLLNERRFSGSGTILN